LTERRLPPLHIATFLGLSAGAYALSLVAVTVLQGQAESVVIAARTPTVQALAELETRNDSLFADGRRARLSYEQAMTSYQRLGTSLTDINGEMQKLSKVVQKVDGMARALPDHVALPVIRRSVVSSGSGGSSGSTGSARSTGGGGGGGAAAAAPPAHASTGASGG
jgi:uncharacterized membrane protein YgcG